MSDLFTKIKYKYQLSDNLNKLLYINIGVFMIYQFLIIFGFLFEINTITCHIISIVIINYFDFIFFFILLLIIFNYYILILN